MEFSEYVDSRRGAIYSKICEYIPIREPEEHYHMVREYSDRQGKYRRPGLLMLTGEIFGAHVDKLLSPSAAMQLSEDWILIHDDIEDDSELRRGKPALHKIYGTEQAINAGDMVHMAMWKTLSDYAFLNGIEGKKVFDKFYDMLTRTVEGQYREIKFIKSERILDGIGEERYYEIIKSKTCYYSVYGPMQIGAMVAGKSDKAISVLKEIGEPAGIAFQIMDDILDMTADEGFGKKRYGDIEEGKLTLIALHAYNSASGAEKAKMDAIYSKTKAEKTKEDVAFVVEMINKYDGIGYAYGVAESYGKKASEALERNSGILPECELKPVFSSAIKELFSRKK